MPTALSGRRVPAARHEGGKGGGGRRGAAAGGRAAAGVACRPSSGLTRNPEYPNGWWGSTPSWGSTPRWGVRATITYDLCRNFAQTVPEMAFPINCGRRLFSAWSENWSPRLCHCLDPHHLPLLPRRGPPPPPAFVEPYPTPPTSWGGGGRPQPGQSCLSLPWTDLSSPLFSK